jgi:hypothetical protein
MRIAFILFLLLSTSSVFSQDSFAKQLNQIIKDSANCFSKFKGDFKKIQDNDSLFYSTITLEGTKENDILVTKILTQYRSEIIDSISERKGKTTVDEWHEKLIGILSGKFKPEKTRIVSWSPVKYGWNFKNGDTWVDISLFPVSTNSHKYFVSLAITHFAEEFYKVK